MNDLEEYIKDTLGTEIRPERAPKSQLGSLPVYIGETYKLYTAVLFTQIILLVEPKNPEDLSILQTVRNFGLLENKLIWKVILLLPHITALNRKRLIEKKINFIVPGKQIYLPGLLIDLNETFTNRKAGRNDEKLLPSAQFLLLYNVLHHHDSWRVEEHSFKEIAGKTGYTPMAITKAVENLTALKLIDVTGDKEKFIQFRLQGRELWQDAINRNILINPVRKRVYIDEKPTGIIMLHSNGSALPEYSDLDFSRQEFYAIDKNIYYNLQDKEEFINENDVEGRYCLEVWKYNPETLLGELPNENQVVDPLSLYLSMKDSRNERIEMALEQVFKKLIW